MFPHPQLIFQTWTENNAWSNPTSGFSFSGNNLTATQTNLSGSWVAIQGTAPKNTGKFYCEINIVSFPTGSNGQAAGLAVAGKNGFVGQDTDGIGLINGSVYFNNIVLGSGPSITPGTPIGIAADFGAKQVWFSVSGATWNAGGGANPATGAGGYSFAGISGASGPSCQFAGLTSGGVVTVNFGSGPFAYVPPAGFDRY